MDKLNIKIDPEIIIGIIVILTIIATVVIAYKIREFINNSKIRKLKSIDIVENEDGTLEIENENEKKILSYFIDRAYEGLENIYINNTWENKRYLYKLLSNIDDLKINIEFNKLSAVDMEKINSIICIFRLSGNINKRLEKLIFEWEEKYIEN